MGSDIALKPLLFSALQATAKAFPEILSVYNGSFAVETKADRSPVTLADRRSHEIITTELSENYSYPVLSEEGRTIPYAKRRTWKHFWLVDPLDGTKEFVKRNGEFTINIAFMEDSSPILGVVYAPQLDLLYFAFRGGGAYRLRGFAGRPYLGAVAGYERIIQQVSCPAVWVRAASVADPAAERLLDDQSYRREQAYAVFAGICRYFGWQPEGGNNHIAGRLSDGRGNVITKALVMLDGWLPIQSDSQGRFMFGDLGGETHRIEVFHKGKAYGPYEASPGRNLELVLGSP